jgi:hypothetical protein
VLGIAPVLVDALCWLDTILSTKTPARLGSKTTSKPKAMTLEPAVKSGRLAATGVPGAPLGRALALILSAVVARGALRRT